MKMKNCPIFRQFPFISVELTLSLSPLRPEEFLGRESGGKEGGGGGGGEVTQCSAFTLRNLLDDRT